MSFGGRTRRGCHLAGGLSQESEVRGQEADNGPRYGGRTDSLRPACPFSMVQPKVTPVRWPAAGTSTWRRARRLVATLTAIVTCVAKARRQGPWRRAPMAASSGNLDPGVSESGRQPLAS